ncbi:MAG: DUF481 domain-containing protein [Alphaproteobacteria bacterium]|nr:DUF481 domain-containing protein [Alphaproteobacteria bacterium]
MTRHAALALLSAASLITPSAAMADRIFLLNGDRLTGSITGTGPDGAILFDSAYGHTFSVPPADIMAIQRDAAPAGAPLTPAPEDAQEAAALEPALGPDDPLEWSGRVNFGASLQDGNASKKDVTVDGKAEARDTLNRFIVGGEFNWAKEEGAVTENDRTAYAEYDRFLTEKWFAGTRVRFRTDELQKLDLRSKYGLFLGYQFFESDDLNLKARGGVDYIRERFEGAKDENDLAGTWALDYDQTFFEDAFTLFHDHDLSIPFDDTGAFLFESNSGLRVPVGQHLVGTAEIEFDWDNDPVPGVREEDTTYSLKLGYEW